MFFGDRRFLNLYYTHLKHFFGNDFSAILFICPYDDDRCSTPIPVSYTHLDVYKRQLLYLVHIFKELKVKKNLYILRMSSPWMACLTLVYVGFFQFL